MDETALLGCMAYVDLNPVRAGMEDNLAESDFTSIQQRIFDYVKHKPVKSSTEKVVMERVQNQRDLRDKLELSGVPQAGLMAFSGSARTAVSEALPFTREDYFELVDSTGRLIKENKRGLIPSGTPKLIVELNIDPDKWIEHVSDFGKRYGFCAGRLERMRQFAQLFGRCLGKGVSCAKKLELNLVAPKYQGLQ